MLIHSRNEFRPRKARTEESIQPYSLPTEHSGELAEVVISIEKGSTSVGTEPHEQKAHENDSSLSASVESKRVEEQITGTKLSDLFATETSYSSSTSSSLTPGSERAFVHDMEDDESDTLKKESALHTEDLQAHTDSGYVTGSYGKSMPPGRDLIQEQEERLEELSDDHSAVVRKSDPEDIDAWTAFSGTDTGGQGYVEDLAVALFVAVEPCQSDTKKMDQISEMLPDLLRAFSLRLGYKASDPMQIEAAYFVRKYRR